MDLAFVIPTFNRAKNLDLVLYGLTLQSDQRFEVAVSDDGSDDDTLDIARSYGDRLSIMTVTHPHDGYQPGFTRNEGVRLLPPTFSHIWFLDSDVVLNPHAVERAREFVDENPKLVVAGRYDWLPPMEVTKEDLAERWGAFISAQLPPKPGKWGEIGGSMVPGLPYGLDSRRNADWNGLTHLRTTGATCSGNLIVPWDAWEMVGGFDENIKAQGQDCDFGRMLGEREWWMAFYDGIAGYHLYHFRNIRFMSESVRWTIQYMREKRGLPPIPEDKMPPIRDQ